MVAIPATTNVNVCETEDATLLSEIALKQDREAFDRLYERYSPAAFNLAYHITGNKVLAEEAFQDAMLRIWTSAHRFQPGNVKAWILRIVARESIRVLKVNRRAKRQPKFDARDCVASDVYTEGLEQNERIAILRQMMEELPVLDRQLVALHFGAGMSQTEIGAALSIAQPTVSVRIKKALDSLRSNLSKVGVASVTMFGSEHLYQALCDGKRVKAEIHTKIIQRSGNFTISKHLAAESTARILAAAKLAVSLCGVIIVSAGMYLWTILPAATPLPRVASILVANVPPETVAETVKKDETISRSWTFDTPEMTEGLKVTGGSWKWNPYGGTGNSGCMRVAKGGVIFMCDFPIKKLPILLSLKILSNPDVHFATPFWVKNGTTAFFDDGLPAPDRSNEASYYLNCYIMDEGFVCQSHGMPQKVFLVKRDNSDTKLLFLLAGANDFLVDDLKLESLDASQTPDIGNYKAVLNMAPQMNSGAFVVPEQFTSLIGGRCTVRFAPPRDRSQEICK